MLNSILGQSIDEFTPPVDFNIYLSGNFAELRANHFHSGIDIKTQGVTGKKIFSIGDGYVSRIKVQTNGYGKSVYINHPQGYTSVYGHLSEYNAAIQKYVKRYQYKNKTHTLDIYPAKNELPVKKGEIIALSGNTGSSSGPHLHFEIRNARNQHPLNVQKFNFSIMDNVEPRIYNFYVYSFVGEDDRRKVTSRKKIGLKLEGNLYSLKQGDTLLTLTPVSFGIEVFDFLNGARNHCGIYYIKMFLEDDLIYHFQTDEFSFAETRYINAHTDYALRKLNNERVQSLFRKPNNNLSMYPFMKNDGIIELVGNEIKKIRIEIADINQNERFVEFYVKGKENSNPYLKNEETETRPFKWNLRNEYTNHLFKIEIPPGSLYEDVDFSYLRIDRESYAHQYVHVIHQEEVPLHLPSKISIKAEGIPDTFLKKACIVRIDEENEFEYEGGVLEGPDWLSTSIRSFGKFTIEIDTLSPQIIPINFRKNADMGRKDQLQLTIRDDLSGIQYYRGFINNQWALFEYDPKNDLLFYRFDEEFLEKGKVHELEVYVTDKRDNTAVFHSTFKW